MPSHFAVYHEYRNRSDSLWRQSGYFDRTYFVAINRERSICLFNVPRLRAQGVDVFAALYNDNKILFATLKTRKIIG